MKKRLLNKFSAGIGNTQNREAWLEEALKKIPDGSRILDAGAGELAQKRFCTHLQYVSQDFAQYDGSGDSKGFQTGGWDNTKLDIVSDITAIPEPDSSFDAIMCVEVFEHLPDPISAIREFSRLVRKGGYLVLTAPFCSLTHFAPYHFYTGFNRYFYEKYLTENGFEIIEIVANGNYFEYMAQELRRLPSVSKKYSNKKISFFNKLFLLKLMFSLKKTSKKDTGSDELLCYGLQVFARKL